MTEEVTSPKKDKAKVTNEVFSIEMLNTFLRAPASCEDEPDFRRLLFAYRGMPVEAFADYLELFVEAGYDLQAKDHCGRTFLEYISRFKAQNEYSHVLEKRLAHI